MSARSFIPATTAFQSVSIILPVIGETVSLEKTVSIILADAAADICELLIIVCQRTTPEAMAVVNGLAKSYPALTVVHQQILPFLGGAMREAFNLARGSHVIMMASDLETDPADVKVLIAESKRQPNAIITATRWQPGGSFSGYNPIKLTANWIFQKLFALLYGVRLTDMTYGYRLFPTALVQAMVWEELRHPFLLETVVKPLRLGVPVIEVPTTWVARTEGQSSNSFMRNFAYFRPGVLNRFRDPTKILQPTRINRELPLS